MIIAKGMSASCKCGVIFTAAADYVLDDKRGDRAVVSLMQQIGQHAARHHQQETAVAVGLATELIGLVLAGQLGITSTDPQFNDLLDQQQAKVLAAAFPSTEE